MDASRGERVGRVSSEWFKRPDDEPFLSLDDLFAQVKGRAEGLFIHIDERAVNRWLQNPYVVNRQAGLLRGYDHWRAKFSGGGPNYPGTAYTLLHSLSHALMAEIALDSGYPASSLKERIYALSDARNGGAPIKCGILIYTATPGAQGTLGGLVAAGSRFSSILRNALARQLICSNDPVCADHEPDGRSGDRATHGAACHGCLLIAETSYEKDPVYLRTYLKEYHAERMRLQSEARRDRARLERAAARAKAAFDRAFQLYINGVTDGPAAEAEAALAQADETHEMLEIHPASVERYIGALPDLAGRFHTADQDAVTIIQELVSAVVVTPTETGLDVVVEGFLGAILGDNPKCRVLMVAEEGTDSAFHARR